MELCKKVEVEEYVIHVEESTNFYTSLRFSLLASPWFPRPLGLAMWSVLHVLLVLYITVMLLAIFSIVFAIAVSFDAFALCFVVLVIFPWLGLLLCVGMSLVVLLSWIQFLISCNVPRRAPGQTLAHYILTAGGELTEGQTTAACLCGMFGDCRQSLQKQSTASLVNHLKLVSIPYWRVNLGNLCREIVPTYDAVVI